MRESLMGKSRDIVCFVAVLGTDKEGALEATGNSV